MAKPHSAINTYRRMKDRKTKQVLSKVGTSGRRRVNGEN
jgi:hypothetical protein